MKNLPVIVTVTLAAMVQMAFVYKRYEHSVVLANWNAESRLAVQKRPPEQPCIITPDTDGSLTEVCEKRIVAGSRWHKE